MIVNGRWRRSVAAVSVLAIGSTIAFAAAQSEPGTTRQAASGRAVVVVLDDLRIAPNERQGIVRALDVIRGALLGDDDLISVVSVGGASVYADLHFASKVERVPLAMARFLAAPETRVRPEMTTPTSARPGPGVTDADLVLQMAATLGRARQAKIAIRIVNGLSPDQLMSRDVVRGDLIELPKSGAR